MPIYDLSYKRIEGVRHPRRFRYLAIAQTGIRQFFKKRLSWILALPAIALTIAGGLFLLLPSLLPESGNIQQLPKELSRFLHLTPDTVFRAIGWFNYCVALVAVTAGGGAIANDIASNALEIYFSRPLTRFDYVFGKSLTIVAVSALNSMVPLLILWILDVSVTEQPGYFAAQVPLLVRTVVAQTIGIALLTLVILAVSSLAKTQRNAMLTIAAILIGLPVVSLALVGITRNVEFRLLNPVSVIERINYEVLDVRSTASAEPSTGSDSVDPSEPVVIQPEVRRSSRKLAMLSGRFQTAAEPLKDVAFSRVLVVAAAWAVLALFVLHRRVRGFEVVKG